MNVLAIACLVFMRHSHAFDKFFMQDISIFNLSIVRFHSSHKQ